MEEKIKGLKKREEQKLELLYTIAPVTVKDMLQFARYMQGKQ